jgi:hypothetical protein
VVWIVKPSLEAVPPDLGRQLLPSQEFVSWCPLYGGDYLADKAKVAATPGKPSKRYARFDLDKSSGYVGSIYVPKADADGIESLDVAITPVRA